MATGGLVFIAGAGVALAYVTGTGSSSSAAATLRPGVLTAAPVTATGLYPGATATATVRISNPGPYPMVVTTVSGGAAPAVTGTGTCPAGSIEVGGATGPTGLPTIAPSATATVPIPVTMRTDASSACQGAVATIPVIVRGTNR